MSYRAGGVESYGFLIEEGVVDYRTAGRYMGLHLPPRLEMLLPRLDEVAERLPRLGRVRPDHRLRDVRLLPPVRPRTVACLALNYGSHAEEAGRRVPSIPVFFFKPPASVTGPYDPVQYPSLVSKLDYEGELVAVIGRKARRLTPENAWEALAGFMVGNDFSARDLQFADGIFNVLSKSFEGFMPLGPWLVTRDEVGDLYALRLRTMVNGEVRQDSRLGDMVHRVEEVVAWLSRAITLEPGDVVCTGTPAGVGMASGRFLRPRDVVRVEIEGIGAIENRLLPEI